MTIPIKRWESLDKDFNVGIKSFAEIGQEVGGTFNDAMPGVSDIAGDIKGVLTDLQGLKQDVLFQATDALKEATRYADDVLGTFTNLAKIPENVFDDVIKSILPDGSLSSASKLKSVLKTCRNNALNRGLGMGNKIPTASCGGGKFRVGGCASSANTTHGLLNDVLGNGGLINKANKAATDALRRIVALASTGYSADLCGVFAAVTDGVKDSGLLSKAAGQLLNSAGLDGDFRMVGDIAKNLTGLNVGAFMPATLRNVAQNIPMPLNLSKNFLGDFGDTLMNVYDEIDGSFMRNSGLYDFSTAQLGRPNATGAKAMRTYTAAELGYEDDLDEPVSYKESLMCSSYEMDDSYA